MEGRTRNMAIYVFETFLIVIEIALLVYLGKVSFFGQCSKMQLIPIKKNLTLKLVLSNFFGF